MLQPAIREALQVELEHLQVQRDKLEARIKALESILSPDDSLGFFEAPPETPRLGRAKPTSNGNLADKGMREALRIVLADYPSGLKPADIKGKLEQMGFRPKGKSSLQVLMFGEVYRMRKQGKLTKRGKRYALAPELTLTG